MIRRVVYLGWHLGNILVEDEVQGIALAPLIELLLMIVIQMMHHILPERLKDGDRYVHLHRRERVSARRLFYRLERHVFA